MLNLENIKANSIISGIAPEGPATVLSARWYGSEALEVTFKDHRGTLGERVLYREDEARLEAIEGTTQWTFDGDGALFRLVSEAQRIRLAHLFDPLLAVHSSSVEPLPHQITAVYESMLPRQPLRFLLADDPGAGKTIMAGLLIKELMARADVQRCLVVCPGSLAEQWQDELYQRFGLPFEIMTNDKLASARTGNWFLENDLVIARLDKLSRNEDLQAKLSARDARWDLVVCDEAHKMSATYFGGEIKYTRRYALGKLLSGAARHFLLMSATPHNGKEEDFQLFMALLDGDRFEGRFRDGVHGSDSSDLMRRMVKEELLRFDGTPLFPPRMAYTVAYRLSNLEMDLYAAVTEYVRAEFNRAEALQNDKRSGTVGFALTVLQRRLASSPEAIYRSLKRRRERLEGKLREAELAFRGALARGIGYSGPELAMDDIEDLDEAPESEIEEAEEAVLDQATAATTVEELKAEIGTLKHLETMAESLRLSGQDAKWVQLAGLLGELFSTRPYTAIPGAGDAGGIPPPSPSPNEKIVIFTEHRDTLAYLEDRISRLLGRPDGIVIIHGGTSRDDRAKAQEAFKFKPEIRVLLATDAAGEGINLQRAHLMVNYDLPWNPNRLEQRFGRIHRIGQTEVCYLWNLVAEETREGDVYRRLLEKLEQARRSLGGRVFDVLGKMQFGGKPLRDLLLEAIRFGNDPEVLGEKLEAVDLSFDTDRIRDLLDDKALARDVMDLGRVMRVREKMERAEARRLQPHYVESFFLEAFARLGGKARQREARRYEVTHVPSAVRQRDREIGSRDPVLDKYERIVFEKDLRAPQGAPLASFVCPGSPLLNAVIDLTLERNGDVLRRGAVLVDDSDPGTEPRVYVYMEHALRDASRAPSGNPRSISRRMLYLEMRKDGSIAHVQYAPYLDFRPLRPEDGIGGDFLRKPEHAWINGDLERRAIEHAVLSVAPGHLKEVREKRQEMTAKAEAAVKDRLMKEINYWDYRANVLQAEERAGKVNARLNSQEARKRADILQERLSKRLEALKLEADVSSLPPLVQGGFLVIPAGLITLGRGGAAERVSNPVDTQESGARARAIIMDTERRLGFEPVDREADKVGYDVESRVPGTGKLRFIEVKGRVSGAPTICVTRNEILYSLNKPEDFILAIVEFLEGGSHRVHYVRNPFKREPDFGACSVNYDFKALVEAASPPS